MGSRSKFEKSSLAVSPGRQWKRLREGKPPRPVKFSDALADILKAPREATVKARCLGRARNRRRRGKATTEKMVKGWYPEAFKRKSIAGRIFDAVRGA